MRVLTIVHEQDAGPGVFATPLADAGVEVHAWLVWQQPEPPAGAGSYGAVISLGGSAHPHQQQRFPWLATEKRYLERALTAGVPVLGICLGCELVASVAGAELRHLAEPEIGRREVKLTDEGRRDPLLGALPERFAALEWHSYACALPSGASALAHSDSCLQAYRVGESAWGLQFHAEVSDADFQHWLDNYEADEDAVRVGIDP